MIYCPRALPERKAYGIYLLWRGFLNVPRKTLLKKCLHCFQETKTGRGITAVSDNLKALKTRNNARIPENTKKSTSWSVHLISDLQGFIY